MNISVIINCLPVQEYIVFRHYPAFSEADIVPFVRQFHFMRPY